MVVAIPSQVFAFFDNPCEREYFDNSKLPVTLDARLMVYRISDTEVGCTDDPWLGEDSENGQFAHPEGFASDERPSGSVLHVPAKIEYEGKEYEVIEGELWSLYNDEVSFEFENGIRALRKAYADYNDSSIVFPESLEYLKDFCGFKGDALELPAGVRTLDGAFVGCPSLRVVTVRGEEPCELLNGSFEGIDSANCTLVVPPGCVDVYRASEWGRVFSNITDDASGVWVVDIETAPVREVYTVDGMKIETDNAGSLPAGLYVIDGRKVLVK